MHYFFAGINFLPAIVKKLQDCIFFDDKNAKMYE